MGIESELDKINGADTAWVMISAALVFIMTPTLGFFYGGLVRQKNVLSLIIQCLGIFAAISIVWAVIGFSLAFGQTSNQFIGNLDFVLMRGVGLAPFEDAPTIPGVVFFFFELCACAIAPALVIGASAERLSFINSVIFSCFWVIIVYCPIAHWVWGYHGWLADLGAVDFGGGMPVHMAAGFSALALAIVIGKRSGDHEKMKASNITYVVLGAAFLWFGWFGYNGGSDLSAKPQAGLAILNTNISCATGTLGWGIIDYIYTRKVSPMGLSIGAVCGLIAMTAGCGFCPPSASLIIGLVGGIASNLVARFREKYLWEKVDDALDVFACHGVCGTWGVFATGLWANNNFNHANGLFNGGAGLLGCQLFGIIAVAIYSFACTYFIASEMRIYGFLRSTEEDENLGLDLSDHNEHSYIIVSRSEVQEEGRSEELNVMLNTHK